MSAFTVLAPEVTASVGQETGAGSLPGKHKRTKEGYVHKSRPRTLQRQDTYILEDHLTQKPAMTKKTGTRPQSGYGIVSILERAESLCSLTPEVREYLASHWRMVGGEVRRLQEELVDLRESQGREQGKQVREVRALQQQVEKERAKNRILIRQRKGGDEDTITISGMTIKNGRGSASPSSSPGSRSGSGEGRQVRLLNKKLRVYRAQVASLRADVEYLKSVIKEAGELEASGRSPQSGASETDSLSELEEERRGRRRKSEPRPSVLRRAGEVERERLGELVLLLTTRLGSAEEKAGEAEAGRREEVRRRAGAETSLERSRLQLREAGVRERAGSREVSAREGAGEEDGLREEVVALRRELKEARAGREEMVRMYQKMIEDVKAVFKEGET